MATKHDTTGCPKCSGTGSFHVDRCPVQQREWDLLPGPVMSTHASMLADLEGAPSEDGYVHDEDGGYGDDSGW